MSNDSLFSTRREIIQASTMGIAAMTFLENESSADSLPVGNAPKPLEAAWFPSRLHAFVWRNWSLVTFQKMADVVGATPEDIAELGQSMGLKPSRGLTIDQLRRAHLTIIRRNWHILPYEQLLTLLGWTAEHMAYTLREDDFFYVKLGLLKPKCEPLHWTVPTAEQSKRAKEIAELVAKHFPEGELEGKEPLFTFIDKLKAPITQSPKHLHSNLTHPPLRMGYSYFALCGDPLLDPALDPYPDGLLARLAATGENAVWLHVELAHLAKVPWSQDQHIDQRIKALRGLTTKAARYGMKIFLYLNEPRSLLSTSPIFTKHPDWRGVPENEFSALCTTSQDVRRGISNAVSSICKAVPELGGFFTISASENLTNCWSHGTGLKCPRCKDRKPAEVIAEVSSSIDEGIRASGGKQRYIAWDWGWNDDWAVDAIQLLPKTVELMSVSEWSLPIERGGVKSTVGEYSISSIGPGPRALRHWAAAKKCGLRVAAKIQCGNTWELSAVPYLPVLENITRHAANLKEAGVTDIMLGWTLGGYPSPNIEAISEINSGGTLETLALKRHGARYAPSAATFWRECSAAFREFPYNGGTVYSAPLQMGPANPLWSTKTGYAACMVGIPYDDLNAWRSIYPTEVFVAQLEKISSGFEAAIAKLRMDVTAPAPNMFEEIGFAEAAGIHFASVANQCRAVAARDAGNHSELIGLCKAEAKLAVRLHELQSGDSRIGFEASNQYYYVPLDLVEKVINCEWVATQPGLQRTGV